MSAWIKCLASAPISDPPEYPPAIILTSLPCNHSVAATFPRIRMSSPWERRAILCLRLTGWNKGPNWTNGTKKNLSIKIWKSIWLLFFTSGPNATLPLSSWVRFFFPRSQHKHEILFPKVRSPGLLPPKDSGLKHRRAIMDGCGLSHSYAQS